MKNDFHMKAWALTLVLKQRPRRTRKWPIGSRQQLSTLSSQPELSIDTVPIEKVTSVKSFGIFIDENLRWQTHIDKLSKKIASGIGAIKRIRDFVPTPEKLYETCYSLGDSGIPRTNFMKNSFSIAEQFSGTACPVIWERLNL